MLIGRGRVLEGPGSVSCSALRGDTGSCAVDEPALPGSNLISPSVLRLEPIKRSPYGCHSRNDQIVGRELALYRPDVLMSRFDSCLLRSLPCLPLNLRSRSGSQACSSPPSFSLADDSDVRLEKLSVLFGVAADFVGTLPKETLLFDFAF